MPRHEKRERIYHHHDNLEEYHAGMWRIVRGEERKDFIIKSAALMSDPSKFKLNMERALDEWPNSCEHNLSAENVNRIAWLGHAGCCIGVESPEDCTRAGWHTLSPDQQASANKAASEVLAKWDANNTEPCFFQMWSCDA